MARTKIDYGIDLGTTNSAISRIENGEATIKKTDILKDTMPSCVSFNAKKALQVGDTSYNKLRRDKLNAMKNWTDESNVFIEFKRTMGTDKMYSSSNLGKDLSSEDLSAEVLKTLKSFVTDEMVNAVVITVPAAFGNNQKEATREAAKLAGFNHIELLQEPVAAAMAYGLDSKNKNGFWLVYDFGGGTFDVALLKVEDGIMKVADTEGDNYLGGKNLDLAIVDEIILPYIEENYAIDSILQDDNKKQILRNAMKFYAEETKIKLSFNDSHNILSDLGDIPGEDDNGEEFELDITVTQADMERALSPIFQKAIDICKKLLERNNLKGSSLDSLILVGGPTFSPVLRKMLEQQICKPDTSVDPMTVVSKGAALYASTIDISEEIKEQTRDKSKIQIEIGHEASTVELEEYVTLKILADKTEGAIPEKVFAEISQSGSGSNWSSGKVEINEIGEVIEILLNEGRTNRFEVTLFDDKGNILESEPKEFTVIQGSKIGSATLAYNIGIEIKKRESGRIVFETLKNLEKNKSIPTIGTRNGLKTQKQIRPGMDSDFIKIPIYEGEHEADGTRAVYNNHVKDIIITGADLPALLPENSDVDLTVNIDRSEQITVTAYFPYLDFSYEALVERTISSIETNWLSNEIRKAKGSIEELKDERISDDKVQKAETEIAELERKFENSKNDVDGKQEVLTNLRKTLKTIDELSETTEWPKLEEELKEEFYRLEKANKDLGNDRSTQVVNQLRNQLEEVLKSQDIKLGKALAEEIHSVFFQMTLVYQLINFIRQHNQHFGSYHWKDSNRARQLVNEGLQQIGENPNTDDLHPIVVDLINLLPNDERPSGDDSVLVG
ncbi:heat-shock protein Hsp70 [Elizabethkingia anophelis]|uniref:Hsp70 family protein n=1 Tax=Elizabethkingia anophelis TaxID=1117645 RepID=UPI0021A41263|nr:Hsp70 family protein [Elizabethkingia anophelis]MCT4197017.1 Hsp70 family protein [Elizabethkingia anophelis]MCT4225039.1 Hsp70 family protein [Elizabethkingia anophelis]MCT4306630.1 Hsp70 family protein [Elizabethkingia anophelis]MDV3870432.1 heat-shock protein Hsp70 [Elizabethkingia anophelis]